MKNKDKNLSRFEIFVSDFQEKTGILPKIEKVDSFSSIRCHEPVDTSKPSQKLGIPPCIELNNITKDEILLLVPIITHSINPTGSLYIEKYAYLGLVVIPLRDFLINAFLTDAWGATA